MLKSWGNVNNAYYFLQFRFKWRDSWETVSIAYESQKDVARGLWSYRRARRAVGSLGHTSYVKASRFPQFGFRWLACRWCTVSIVNRRGSIFWSLTVPPGGFRRRNIVGVRPRPRTLWELIDWSSHLGDSRE